MDQHIYIFWEHIDFEYFGKSRFYSVFVIPAEAGISKIMQFWASAGAGAKAFLTYCEIISVRRFKTP